MPWRCVYLLELFFEFCQFRYVDGYGEHPASWRDLDPFERMTGHRFTRWERTAFRRMDNAYFAAKSPPAKPKGDVTDG